MSFPDLLPSITTPVPGPRSVAAVDVLARHECPAITARRSRRAESLGVASTDPIVWDRAEGCNVWDVDGNRYVDLTSGFGVALPGHRHPFVVEAAKQQTDTLLHAMGDAFPDMQRITMLEALFEVAPKGMQHAILGLSGSDAIDAMVKTALLATGRTGVLVFEGSYHGLSLGAVPLQRYKPGFLEPFAAITHPRVVALPYGCSAQAIRERLELGDIGLVIAEPIQGRGGMRPPPDGWLDEVRSLTLEHGVLLGLDEIQSGMGRTGQVWAWSGSPDLLAVGKALGGGFPISACLGTRQAMEAWGASTGEALHTQTFLGHPVGCAAANAVLGMLPTLLVQVRHTASLLEQALQDAGWTLRGRGLMLGVHHPDALAAMRMLLEAGYIVLPAGMRAEVLGLTPPAPLSADQIQAFVAALELTR